jgi:hypothetical protein
MIELYHAIKQCQGFFHKKSNTSLNADAAPAVSSIFIACSTFITLQSSARAEPVSWALGIVELMPINQFSRRRSPFHKESRFWVLVFVRVAPFTRAFLCAESICKTMVLPVFHLPHHSVCHGISPFYAPLPNLR